MANSTYDITKGTSDSKLEYVSVQATMTPTTSSSGFEELLTANLTLPTGKQWKWIKIQYEGIYSGSAGDTIGVDINYPTINVSGFPASQGWVSSVAPTSSLSVEQTAYQGFTVEGKPTDSAVNYNMAVGINARWFNLATPDSHRATVVGTAI